MTGFLRRNVRALVALPVLLALAVAASGQRVVQLWWPYEMVHEVDVDASGTARFDGEVETPKGMQDQQVSVHYVETAPTDRMPMLGDEDVSVPDGWTGVRVRVHVETDPYTPLALCQVLLVDGGGVTYRAGTGSFDEGIRDDASCQPRDVENPTGLEQGEVKSTRPPSYDRDVVFVLPEGVRPATVRVSPDTRQYADWPLTAGS